MRRTTTPDAELLARVAAIEAALIEVAALLEQLHVLAVERLAEPLADMRERHKPTPSRLSSVKAMIGL